LGCWLVAQVVTSCRGTKQARLLCKILSIPPLSNQPSKARASSWESAFRRRLLKNQSPQLTHKTLPRQALVASISVARLSQLPYFSFTHSEQKFRQYLLT
jgi:hypothetical protein